MHSVLLNACFNTRAAFHFIVLELVQKCYAPHVLKTIKFVNYNEIDIPSYDYVIAKCYVNPLPHMIFADGNNYKNLSNLILYILALEKTMVNGAFVLLANTPFS